MNMLVSGDSTLGMGATEIGPAFHVFVIFYSAPRELSSIAFRRAGSMFVSQIMTAAIATTVIIRRIVNRTCGKLTASASMA